MSETLRYLELIENKLRRQVEKESVGLQYGKDEIHRMNEFFWENYTEMDEYGYEDYDNQQALLRQADANRKKKEEIRKLIRMQDSPFFGGLYFCYEDEDEPEMFYIGIGNFAEELGQVPLIFDWRAPVSSMFYDYDRGPAAYDAPEGHLEGELIRKHQYKIRGGKLIYEFENDTKIDDEILMQELGKHSSVQMKNIVRTIQKEQNLIIRNTRSKIMVIQGAAGSGKTSIALHRIAYLLYHERDKLRSSQVLILSPNGVFSDYISHILPELGEENIREMSFDVYAYHQLKEVVFDCEDRFQQMEKSIREDRMGRRRKDDRYRYKQSRRMVEDIDMYLKDLEDYLVDIRDVTFSMAVDDGNNAPRAVMTMTAKEIRGLFHDSYAGAPLLARMDLVAERFIDEFETLHLFRKGREIPEEQKELIIEEFRSMYSTMDVYLLYSRFLEDMAFPPLPEVPKEERFLSYEDVYPLLYLKLRLCRRPVKRDIRHLVIDEMQDYSYLQYVILRELFPCRMTILGDRAQALEPEQEDVLHFLPDILGDECHVLQLNRSYRNTTEISEYAGSIIPWEDIEVFERHGEPVRMQGIRDREEMMEKLIGFLREADSDHENIAVLALTQEQADEISQLLQQEELGRPVHRLDRQSLHFYKGITVTAWYLAKGLEFDQVFVLPSNAESSYDRQYRYISATRAMHRLTIFEQI